MTFLKAFHLLSQQTSTAKSWHCFRRSKGAHFMATVRKIGILDVRGFCLIGCQSFERLASDKTFGQPFRSPEAASACEG